MTVPSRRRYRDSRQRMLVDMHIPDHDRRFLQSYDPAALIDQLAATGADGLMLYVQSHTGLCLWPTVTGQQHRALAGTDPVARVLERAEHHGLPACAYYSVQFNNWAAQRHPDWRLQPAAEALIGGGLLQRARYGLCCLNHPDYRRFVFDQLAEVVTGYAFDAVFFDMLWWMSVCVCRHCRERCLAETGRALPETIDWFDPGWCRFQAARERWVAEFAIAIREHVRRLRPGTDVYLNFALGLANWTRGVGFASAQGHDFLGGDFYGGAAEQLLVSRLMLNLSPGQPVEFMTTVAANLAEHEQLKPARTLALQNLTATAFGAAFLMIAALDPDGGINPAALERCRDGFAQARPFLDCVGGEPVEDIAVHCSDASKMSFTDNGKPLAEAPFDTPFEYPHLKALTGVCAKLQRAHLPFGVITRRQLADLSRYRVVVLPDVLRMDQGEVSAIREYVRGGGRVYASAHTSLTGSGGTRHRDFALAEVFGCHFQQTETGLMVHLEPAAGIGPDALAGQRMLSHWVGPERQPAVLRVTGDPDAEVLMRLNLPYGYPGRGSLDGNDWASIHSSPPWQSTAYPGVVRNRFGSGQAVYSAATLEAGDSAAHEALFVHLVRLLGEDDWSISCEAGTHIWMSAFRQPESRRWILSFLHHCEEEPAPLPAPVTFRLREVDGIRWTRLATVPQGRALDFTRRDGRIVCTFQPQGTLTMIAASYSPPTD